MPLSEKQQAELERIRSDDPSCIELLWGGTLLKDGGLDDADMSELARAISCDLTLRNHHLRSISIRNNTKIGEHGAQALLTVLPHSRIVAIDTMNVRVAGQTREDLKEELRAQVAKFAPPVVDDSMEREAQAAAQREAQRQAAVVAAAADRDRQQRVVGCVAGMPVTLNAHVLRPSTAVPVAWQPTEVTDLQEDYALTEKSLRVTFRGALTDERPGLDARRRHKQHKLRAEEVAPIERREVNRKRTVAPPPPSVLREQGRPVVCGRRGRPVAPEQVTSVRELQHKKLLSENGSKGTLLHVAARGTIMTQPVRHLASPWAICPIASPGSRASPNTS
jgi:hypothetical protein